jgi:hypothetical protein
MPKLCKRLDGMLGIIIVPRHIVVIQKCKKRVPVLLETIHDFLSGVTRNAFSSETSVEMVNGDPMFPQSLSENIRRDYKVFGA